MQAAAEISRLAASLVELEAEAEGSPGRLRSASEPARRVLRQ